MSVQEVILLSMPVWFAVLGIAAVCQCMYGIVSGCRESNLMTILIDLAASFVFTVFVVFQLNIIVQVLHNLSVLG